MTRPRTPGPAGVPYANARSGLAARDEISRMLRQFGCEKVGFMDEHAEGAVLLVFAHRGRQVELRASAKGWAAMFLRARPWSGRGRQKAREKYEQDALRQGLVAVNSVLRDWVKGQVTAIECGAMSFEAVFSPFVLTDDGRPVWERLAETRLLPAPSGA